MEKYIHIEYSSGDLGGGNLICDGVNDSDMIDEAIGLLSRNGGGSICFDGGIYNLSRPIIILDDNIHIVGNKVLKTIFRPTDDWRQYETIDGAYVNGVVNFVGVDNYGVSNITTDPLWNNVICNGINSIPSGKNGAGDVCTNGTIENNEILLSNGHAYGIWNQRSKDTLISNNVVNGFSSDGMSPHQEGVEVYGGYNVNESPSIS